MYPSPHGRVPPEDDPDDDVPDDDPDDDPEEEPVDAPDPDPDDCDAPSPRACGSSGKSGMQATTTNAPDTIPDDASSKRTVKFLVGCNVSPGAQRLHAQHTSLIGPGLLTGQASCC
jgi:hypothetical protein